MAEVFGDTYARGAAPEIIEDGETGFLVNASENNTRGIGSLKNLVLEDFVKQLKEFIPCHRMIISWPHPHDIHAKHITHSIESDLCGYEGGASLWFDEI